jgi:molybdenum cofactor biosynthesis enzyme MoaA
MNITFDTLPQNVAEIIERLGKIEQRLEELMEEKNKNDEFFSEYIPKSEVRGKLASSATLWNLERQGKLTSYGIGGKRYYKRSEIENLIQPVKQNNDEI